MRHALRHTAVLMFGLALLASCGRGGEDVSPGRVAAPDPAFERETEAWRQQRHDQLLQPHGWTSLVGLHWLDLKAHFIGSGPGSGVRLAVGPPKLGLVQRDGGQAWFTPERGVAVTLDGLPLRGRARLHSDAMGTPGVIGFDDGKGQLGLIERGGRQALQVRHEDASTRLDFATLQYWPADPAWRVQGRFVAHPAGQTLAIGDIVGTTSDLPNPGRIEFTRGDQAFALEALAGEGNRLFVVLADRTSGHGSYSAGRFLDVPAPDAQGNLVLDFNRAYNPPCAFTAFATCLLPPAQNRLDLLVSAGERAYAPPKGSP